MSCPYDEENWINPAATNDMPPFGPWLHVLPDAVLHVWGILQIVESDGQGWKNNECPKWLEEPNAKNLHI